MSATRWTGLYDESWHDLIVPEAFSHPAKMARGLIHRIYRHLIDQGYVRAGEHILDPFVGVACGALDAMTYGLSWTGCELETRFVALGNQNLTLWRQRFGFITGQLLQGDSRQLGAMLAGQAQGMVTSPPFLETIATENGADFYYARGKSGEIRGSVGQSYGMAPGQLGAMPAGALVTSPPFMDAQKGGGLSAAMRGEGQYTVTTHLPTNLYQPAEQGTEQGTTPGNLANDQPPTFWAAATQILTACWPLLQPGAICAFVLKDYIRKKQRVPFCAQWRACCEAVGYTFVEEIWAMLVEDHGTQTTIFGEDETVSTSRKSFFRRLAERKGSPRIDYEVVLLMRRP